MVGRLAALILLSALSQTVDMQPQISMTVVEPGEDFNLMCFLTGQKAGLFYWYKLKFGHMVETIARGSFEKVKLEEQFNSRHSLTFQENLYCLNIRNVSKEDEATYFCQAGTAYEMKVMNSTLIAVNDHKNQQSSVYLKQRPETQSVQAGGSVRLQCSLLSKSKENREQCPGEHSVYWFRAESGDTRPAVIYTQSHRSDEEEEEERSCVYSLSKTIHDSSDAGTYHCAVLTCGQILFGEGTTVKTEQEPWPFYITLGTLLPYSVFVTAALVLYHRYQRAVCKQCKGEKTSFNQVERHRSAEGQPNNEEGGEAAMNYVALDFAARKTTRWTTTREQSLDCTYSGVGQSL